MPYINKTDRHRLDPYIDDLIRGLLYNDYNEGELNYVICRIFKKTLDLHGVSYKEINRLMGILSCIQQEFYRRIAADYENEKIKQNGDVF